MCRTYTGTGSITVHDIVVTVLKVALVIIFETVIHRLPDIIGHIDLINTHVGTGIGSKHTQDNN